MPEPVTIPTIHREDVRYLCERDYQRPAVNVILDMCGFRREIWKCHAASFKGGAESVNVVRERYDDFRIRLSGAVRRW